MLGKGELEVYAFDQTYLEGFCRLREQWRVLRIDRIRQLQITHTRFEARDCWKTSIRKSAWIIHPLGPVGGWGQSGLGKGQAA